jgi:hypothetical protein
MGCGKSRSLCWLIVVLLLSPCVLAFANIQSRIQGWKPAVYRNLVMGKSTRRDLLRLLGKPKFTAIPDGQSPTDRYQEVWYYYDLKGEITGELTAYIDKRNGLIRGLNVSPDKFSKADAIRLFGADYVETHYQFCQCREASDSAPVYETSAGNLAQLEYRSRGIAIQFHSETASIEYLDGPYGLANKAECRAACRR